MLLNDEQLHHTLAYYGVPDKLIPYIVKLTNEQKKLYAEQEFERLIGINYEALKAKLADKEQ